MKRVDAEAGYREAFEEFSRKAQHVQSLSGQKISGSTFEEALLELERAHLAYNRARDAFLESLLPDSARQMAGDEDRTADVSSIAELLWESAGRPGGTAEQDWLRAESIVKRALETAVCG